MSAVSFEAMQALAGALNKALRSQQQRIEQLEVRVLELERGIEQHTDTSHVRELEGGMLHALAPHKRLSCW